MNKEAHGGPSRLPALFLVLVACMGAGPLLQAAIPVVGPELMEDLRMNRTGFGMLTAAIFAVATATSFFGNDRMATLGSARAARLTFLTAALACVVAAVSMHWSLMIVAMAIAGLPMALSNPATNQMLYESVPARRRGLAAGMKQAGVKVGHVLAGVLVAPVAALWGWRSALILLAVLVLLPLLVRLPAVKQSGLRGETSAAPAPTPGIPAGVRPMIPWLVFYCFCMGVVQTCVVTYLPLFGRESIGLSLSEAGLVLAVTSALGVAARILGGVMLEGVLHKRLTLGIIVAGSGACISMLLAAELTSSTLLYLIAAAGLGLTAPLWSVYVIFAMTQWTGGPGLAQLTGHVYTGFYGGLMVTLPLFGLLADLAGYAAGWTVVLVILAGAVLGCTQLRPVSEGNS